MHINKYKLILTAIWKWDLWDVSYEMYIISYIPFLLILFGFTDILVHRLPVWRFALLLVILYPCCTDRIYPLIVLCTLVTRFADWFCIFGFIIYMYLFGYTGILYHVLLYCFFVHWIYPICVGYTRLVCNEILVWRFTHCFLFAFVGLAIHDTFQTKKSKWSKKYHLSSITHFEFHHSSWASSPELHHPELAPSPWAPPVPWAPPTLVALSSAPSPSAPAP